MPTLSAAIDARQQHIPVANPAQNLRQGTLLRIDDEVIRLEGYDGGPFPGGTDYNSWHVRRGQNGTAADAHDSGANIQAATDAFLAGTFTEPPSPFDTGTGAGRVRMLGPERIAFDTPDLTTNGIAIFEGEIPANAIVDAFAVTITEWDGAQAGDDLLLSLFVPPVTGGPTLVDYDLGATVGGGSVGLAEPNLLSDTSHHRALAVQQASIGVFVGVAGTLTAGESDVYVLIAEAP
jgi:hypothetical protein